MTQLPTATSKVMQSVRKKYGVKLSAQQCYARVKADLNNSSLARAVMLSACEAEILHEPMQKPRG